MTQIARISDAVRITESMKGLQNEQFRVLLMDASNALLLDRVTSIGDRNSVQPCLTSTVQLVLNTAGCRGMVVAHNHPSGDPRPSHPDVQFTRRLHRILKELGFNLYDHLVVATSGTTSMRAEGAL